MRWLPLAIALLLFIPFASAFEIGGFEIKDGNLIGKYHPSGLEGCTISCYTNKHVLDIVYKKDSIDLKFDLIDDPLLEKLVNANPVLKDAIEKDIVNRTIRVKGPKLSIEYPPNGCKVELHDTPTRFLKIETNKIVIQTNGEYKIERIGQRENEVKIEKNGFTSFLLSNNPVLIEENNITLYGNMVFASFSLEEPMKAEQEKIEKAFLDKNIGGEVYIYGKQTDNISFFGNVSINVDKSMLEKGKVVLKVRGDDEEYGKVIKVGIAKMHGKIVVRYDGRVIEEADGIEDILNPNDDGSNPEYLVLSSNKDGTFMLVSIPHFSEHKISIEFIVENPVARLVAISFGLLIVAIAAFYIFKP